MPNPNGSYGNYVCHKEHMIQNNQLSKYQWMKNTKTSTKSYYPTFYKGQGLMFNDKKNDPKVLYL